MSFREEVDAINARFHDAFNKRDAAGVAADYAEDCLWMFNSKEPVRGRAAIQKAYGESIAGGLKLKSLKTVHAEMKGQLGYSVLTYETNEGAGTSLGIYRRDKNGNLVICAESITTGT